MNAEKLVVIDTGRDKPKSWEVVIYTGGPVYVYGWEGREGERERRGENIRTQNFFGNGEIYGVCSGS